MASIVKCLHCGREHSSNLQSCPSCYKQSQLNEDQIERKKEEFDKKNKTPCRVCGEMLYASNHRYVSSETISRMVDGTEKFSTVHTVHFKPCSKCGEPEPIKLLHDSGSGRIISYLLILIKSIVVTAVYGFLAVNIFSPAFCQLLSDCHHGGNLVFSVITIPFAFVISFSLFRGRMMAS